MVLYHGSREIVENPRYGFGKKNNDYGQGLYCTEHKDLACEWAVDMDLNGYCNKYELDMTGLSVLRLNSEEYSILHWITILLQNRTFDVQSDFGQEVW